MMARTASCSCGQLQVSCRGEPQAASLCHCLECQRRTGSTYGIAAFFPRTQTSVQGRVSTYERPSDSGSSVAFHFCPHRGSTVYWEPRRKPDAIAVAVGAFGDPGFPAPTQSVWTERRHPWVVTPR